MSDESVNCPATSDNSLNQTLDNFINPKLWVKFNGSCSKIDRVFTPYKIMNLHIVFEIKSWLFYNNNNFTLRNFLFGAAKLTINLDPDNYSYSGHVFYLMYVEFFNYQMVGFLRM